MKALSWKALVALLGTAAILGACSIGMALAATAPAQKAIVDEYGNLRLRIVESSYTPTAADPNFDSGWHIHPGPAIVQVQQGSFQITQGSCTPKTVNAGDTFIEIPYVPVRAVATGSIVWTTTLLGKYEDKLLTPVASPC